MLAYVLVQRQRLESEKEWKKPIKMGDRGKETRTITLLIPTYFRLRELAENRANEGF